MYGTVLTIMEKYMVNLLLKKPHNSATLYFLFYQLLGDIIFI